MPFLVSSMVMRVLASLGRVVPLSLLLTFTSALFPASLAGFWAVLAPLACLFGVFLMQIRFFSLLLIIKVILLHFLDSFPPVLHDDVPGLRYRVSILVIWCFGLLLSVLPDMSSFLNLSEGVSRKHLSTNFLVTDSSILNLNLIHFSDLLKQSIRIVRITKKVLIMPVGLFCRLNSLLICHLSFGV